MEAESSLKANTAPTAPVYTEHPFPDDGVIRTTGARILKSRVRSPKRIIDIGCGTGEVVAGIATMFPQTEIIAVDINPASIERARQLVARNGLKVQVVQADIGADLVDALSTHGLLKNGGFDVIVSFGVLHHLADPAEGFRQVRGLATPDCQFLCYMYSRHGRREDMAVKQFLTEVLGEDAPVRRRNELLQQLRIANRDTIGAFFRSLRQRLRYGPPIVPSEMLRLMFTRKRATRQADSFSNTCEHLYSFGELEQLCAETGWKLDGLADRGGLPVEPPPHLAQLPRSVAYDLLAFQTRVAGFCFWATPV